MAQMSKKTRSRSRSSRRRAGASGLVMQQPFRDTVFPEAGNLVGQTPWSAAVPLDPPALSKPSKPTRASAAVRGDRPTLMQIAQYRENYMTLRMSACATHCRFTILQACRFRAATLRCVGNLSTHAPAPQALSHLEPNTRAPQYTCSPPALSLRSTVSASPR